MSFTTPNVTIVNVSTFKISMISENSVSLVTFTIDKDIDRYRVCLNGVSYDTGIILDEDVMQASANTEIIIGVEYSEHLSEGDNAIYIHCRDTEGYWSTQSQNGYENNHSSSYGNSTYGNIIFGRKVI